MALLLKLLLLPLTFLDLLCSSLLVLLTFEDDEEEAVAVVLEEIVFDVTEELRGFENHFAFKCRTEFSWGEAKQSFEK